MADWQRTLDIKTEWNQANADEISTKTLARAVAKKLSDLAPFDGDSCEEAVRLELIDQFEEIAGSPHLSKDEFNCSWEELYDWADTALDDRPGGKKVCWVKIF